MYLLTRALADKLNQNTLLFSTEHMLKIFSMGALKYQHKQNSESLRNQN